MLLLAVPRLHVYQKHKNIIFLLWNHDSALKWYKKRNTLFSKMFFLKVCNNSISWHRLHSAALHQKANKKEVPTKNQNQTKTKSMLGVLLDIIEGSGGKTDKDEGVTINMPTCLPNLRLTVYPGLVLAFLTSVLDGKASPIQIWQRSLDIFFQA